MCFLVRPSGCRTFSTSWASRRDTVSRGNKRGTREYNAGPGRNWLGNVSSTKERRSREWITNRGYVHNFNTINIPTIPGRVVNEIDAGWKTRLPVNFLEIRRFRRAETLLSRRTREKLRKDRNEKYRYGKYREKINKRNKRERERENGRCREENGGLPEIRGQEAYG